MGEFKNRINVTINDQHYTIVGEDNPEHIRHVAHLVDEKLKELGSRSAGLDSRYYTYPVSTDCRNKWLPQWIMAKSHQLCL